MQLNELTPERRALRDAFIHAFPAPVWQPTDDHLDFQNGGFWHIDAEFTAERRNPVKVSLIQEYGAAQLEAHFPTAVLLLAQTLTPPAGLDLPQFAALADRLLDLPPEHLIAFLHDRLGDPAAYWIGLEDDFHDLTPEVIARFVRAADL